MRRVLLLAFLLQLVPFLENSTPVWAIWAISLLLLDPKRLPKLEQGNRNRAARRAPSCGRMSKPEERSMARRLRCCILELCRVPSVHECRGRTAQGCASLTRPNSACASSARWTAVGRQCWKHPTQPSSAPQTQPGHERTRRARAHNANVLLLHEHSRNSVQHQSMAWRASQQDRPSA